MNQTRSIILWALFLAPLSAPAGDPKWKHLSSATGDLPVPGPSTEQTGALVADLDKDGTNDFVLRFRKVAPALVWYRPTSNGWDRFVIETNFLTVEAGGAAYDIDGDGVGPLRFYECLGNPEKAQDWVGRDLLERDMIHGHSLQVADINGDGHLDIFAAEMAKWSEPGKPVDNPGATAWILYGDGQGNFRKTVFATGIDFHEARVADLNGDGRLDILDKPYTWDAPRLDIWLQLPPRTR